MKAYKCDRCGELFEPTFNSHKFKVKKYIGLEYEDVDLCKSCNDELEKFLRGENNDKKMKK